MIIRGGHELKNIFDISKIHDISEIANISGISNASKVIDLPESNKNIKTKKRKNKKRKLSGGTAKDLNSKITRFAEYLSGRKYYILVLSFIFITGLLIGAVLVKNLDKKEVFDLCSVIDSYFSGVDSINMTARIFGNIALSLAFLFGIYISGITVFSPFICSAFCLYKGLSCGFIIGVYIIGGATLFHLGICAINFALYLIATIFFILACGESMSFSAFLFKSEDNFKSNLSFKNISVYSSRYLLFLILLSLAAVVQTVAIPIIYLVFG